MAEQKNTLVIEVDARNAENNIKKLTEELKKITEAGSKAAADSQKLGTTINQTNKITQVFNTTVNNSTKNINNNTKTVNNNTTAVERNSQVVDRNSRAVASQSSAFQQLASYMAGILTVGTAISKMDAYTNLQNRLKLVTTNQEELNKSLKDTFAIAQETAQAWGTVTMVYQRFADNAKKLNLTMDDTASLTNTVAKAIAVSGASATSAEAALMQFGQALASGVLRGEEFNSIAEQAPALLKAIATGLDVDIGRLRAMAGEGKLTGEVVVGALREAKVSVDELFAKTDFSIANGFTQLNNAVIEFVGEAGHANGAATFLSASLKTLSENLGAIANVAVLGGIAYLTKAIAVQTVATYKSVDASIARRASTIAEAQASATASASELSRSAAIMNLTKWQLEDAKAQMLRLSGMQRQAYLQNVVLVAEAKHTAAIAAHKVALDADTLAQNANTAARSRGAMVMGALGGWTGLLTIGVTALAAGYMYLKSKADEVNDSYSTQITRVDELAQKYRELNTAKLVQEQELVNQKLKDFKSDAIDAENAITRLAGSSQRAVGKQKEQQGMLAIIAKDLRNGATTTEKALAKMVNSGLFSDKHIAKAGQYFDEFRVAKSGVGEMERQLAFIADQTGLFGNATDEASKKLNNQKIILNAMADSYESLNDEFKNSVNWLLQQDSALKTNERSIAIVNKAVEDYNKGTLTASELAKVLREQLPIESDTIKGIESLAKETLGAKNELEKARKEAEKIPAAGEKAKTGFTMIGTAADEAKGAVAGLSAELEKVNKSMNDRQYDATYINKLLQAGYSEQQAKDLLEQQRAKGLNAGLTKSDLVQTKATWKAEEQLDKTLDSIEKKEKAIADALKEQNKEREKGNRLVGLVGSTGRSTGPHLHVQYPSGSKKGGVTAEHLARFDLGGKTLNPKNSNSHYGKIRDGVPHGGWDFKAPAGTPVTTNVGVKSVTKHIQKEGGKVVGGGYYTRVTFEDGVVIDLMHQIPEMMTKIKGGASKGNATKSANEAYDVFLDAQKEADDLQKERDEMAVKLLYENMGRVLQIEDEKQRRIKEIEFASFKDDATKQAMLDDAKNRAEAEKQLYKDQLTYEMNEFQASEKWKLEQSHKIKKAQIILNKELDSNNRETRLRSLEAEYEQNKKFLELAVSARESEYEQLYMNESQLIIQRYADEVREAMKVRDIDEQNHLVRMANARRELAIQAQLDNARNDWRQNDPNDTNPYKDVEAQETARKDSSNRLLEAETYRLENENKLNNMIDFNERMAKIKQDGADRINEIEEKAAAERTLINVKNAGDIAGSFAGMFKSISGEQSSAYKIMFATEKAFAIASTMLSIKTAIAKAAASGPFPANLGAMATVAALTGTLVSDIMSIGNVGFKSGGYTGNGGTSDVAGVVHGKEYVLNAEATRRVGVGTLNAVNNGGSLGGGINVSIQNYGSGKQFEVQQISANDVRIIARDEARKAVSSDLANPNSQVSKAVSQNTNAVRNRG